MGASTLVHKTRTYTQESLSHEGLRTAYFLVVEVGVALQAIAPFPLQLDAGRCETVLAAGVRLVAHLENDVLP